MKPTARGAVDTHDCNVRPTVKNLTPKSESSFFNADLSGIPHHPEYLPAGRFGEQASLSKTSTISLSNGNRNLTSLIEWVTIEHRDPYAVGNPHHGQSAGGIELQRETQTTAFTKPEKHWTPAPGVVPCAPVNRASNRHRLKSKQFAVPQLSKRGRAGRVGTLTKHRHPFHRLLSLHPTPQTARLLGPHKRR